MKNRSDNCLKWMKWIGNFGPTTRIEDRTVKGYMIDEDGDAGKAYLSSRDLRELATACVEMADWLDARADSPEQREPKP